MSGVLQIYYEDTLLKGKHPINSTFDFINNDLTELNQLNELIIDFITLLYNQKQEDLSERFKTDTQLYNFSKITSSIANLSSNIATLYLQRNSVDTKIPKNLVSILVGVSNIVYNQVFLTKIILSNIPEILFYHKTESFENFLNLSANIAFIFDKIVEAKMYRE